MQKACCFTPRPCRELTTLPYYDAETALFYFTTMQRIGNFTVLRCRDSVKNKLTLPYYNAEIALFIVRQYRKLAISPYCEADTRSTYSCSYLIFCNPSFLIEPIDQQELPYYGAEKRLFYRTTMQKKGCFTVLRCRNTVLRCRNFLGKSRTEIL